MIIQARGKLHASDVNHSIYLVMSHGDLSDQTEPSSDAHVSPLQQESAPSTAAPNHEAR